MSVITDQSVGDTVVSLQVPDRKTDKERREREEGRERERELKLKHENFILQGL